MESYKEELFFNETSYSFLSPPCTTGPFSKWVASHELIQCSYYFKKDYVFLLCETARSRERAASHHVLNHPAMRNTEGNDCFSQEHKRRKQAQYNECACFIFTLSKTVSPTVVI